MKNIRNLSFALIGFMCAPSQSYAASAQRAIVNLSAAAKCTGGVSPLPYTVEWTQTCNNIPVRGIAVCSAQTASSEAQASTYLSVLEGDGKKNNCWCQVHTPVYSARWVFTIKFSTADVCAGTCSVMCANSLGIKDPPGPTFRANAFGAFAI